MCHDPSHREGQRVEDGEAVAPIAASRRWIYVSVSVADGNHRRSLSYRLAAAPGREAREDTVDEVGRVARQLSQEVL